MRRNSIIFGCLLVITQQATGQQSSDSYSELTSKIDAIVNEYKFNGVISVSNSSTGVYSKAVGFSDRESKTRIDLNDQFVIGPISKQTTAVLVLREYEKGEIKLNETINEFLEISD